MKRLHSIPSPKSFVQARYPLAFAYKFTTGRNAGSDRPWVVFTQNPRSTGKKGWAIGQAASAAHAWTLAARRIRLNQDLPA